MKVIAVGTLKGGTGKTTMTFNLLGALAERGKVLAIDIDPQCNLSNNIGIDISDVEDTASSLNIFENKNIDPTNLVVESPIWQLPNLDVIPSSIRLVATELQISGRAGRERILQNYIEDHSDFFKKYDYIVIDTNPSMGIVNQNAFLAANSIILVTDVDENSRVGLKLFLDLWDAIRHDLRKEDNVKAIILNKGALRNNLSDAMWNYLEGDSQLSKLFIRKMIRTKDVYKYAAIAKTPMNLYRDMCPRKDRVPAAEAAQEIEEVVDLLVEKGVL